MGEQHPGHDDASLHTDRGNTRIGDNVVSRIAEMTAGEMEGVLMGGSIAQIAGGHFQSVTGSHGQTQGVSVEVDEVGAAIDLTIRIEYGKNIPHTVERIQRGGSRPHRGSDGAQGDGINVTVSDIVSTEGQEKTSREGIQSASQTSVPMRHRRRCGIRRG